MSDSDLGDLDQELLALGGEEEEEGEASSVASPQNSLGSGAMSESDSEGDNGHGKDEAVLYPLEGKYVDEADRTEIMNMPEIKREEILARRAEEAERLYQDQQLRRMAQSREREEAKAAERKKRKASAADLDDGQRKSSRPKTKASEALESYRKQREQRKQQNDRRARRRSSGSPGAKSAKSATSADAEGESEAEWDKPAKPSIPDDTPADLQDLNRARVGRSNFARYCFYPRFQELIIGCMARVNIGMNKSTGGPLYRIARITGFKAGKPYRLDNPENGRPFMCDQYASLQIGKASPKDFPFNSCSDQKITEDELDKYYRTLVGEEDPVPKKSVFVNKIRDINTLLHTPLKTEDIERRLSLLQKYPVPAKLMNKNAPTSSEVQNRRLEELNAANRKANIEGTRKALIAERKAQQRGRDAALERAQAQKRREEEEAKAKSDKLLKVPGSKIDELFEGSDRSRSATPSGQKSLTVAKPERKGIPTFKKMSMDDEIIGAMDLGIDIDI